MKYNRKRLSKDQKFITLKEHFDKGTPLSELARVNNIHPITLYRWKRQMKKDIDRHTKALGNAHLDVECAKEIIEILKKKSQEHKSRQQKKS